MSGRTACRAVPVVASAALAAVVASVVPAEVSEVPAAVLAEETSIKKTFVIVNSFGNFAAR